MAECCAARKNPWDKWKRGADKRKNLFANEQKIAAQWQNCVPPGKISLPVSKSALLTTKMPRPTIMMSRTSCMNFMLICKTGSYEGRDLLRAEKWAFIGLSEAQSSTMSNGYYVDAFSQIRKQFLSCCLATPLRPNREQSGDTKATSVVIVFLTNLAMLYANNR